MFIAWAGKLQREMQVSMKAGKQKEQTKPLYDTNKAMS